MNLDEKLEVGSWVHVGHATKGGSGIYGKVTKLDGDTVHIKNDSGKTHKGLVKNTTIEESMGAGTLNEFIEQIQGYIDSGNIFNTTIEEVNTIEESTTKPINENVDIYASHMARNKSGEY